MAVAGVIAGAIIGSFLSTIVLRWPKGESVLWGRSHCDACGHMLGPAELVPILSALVLKGRCRACGAGIDPLHFQVEVASAIVGAAAMLLAPLPVAIAWAGLGWILLTLAILDARHFWLPNALTLPLLALGLMCAPWVSGVERSDAMIGAAAGYLALAAVALAYRHLRGREGLGMGDAKLLGALGAWFGWQSLPFILLIASVSALLWALLLSLRHRNITALTMLPLGTFLAVAAVPGWLAAAWMLVGD